MLHILSLAAFLGTSIALLECILIQGFIIDISGNPVIVLYKVVSAVTLLGVLSLYNRYVVKAVLRKKPVQDNKLFNVLSVTGSYFSLIFLQLIVRVIPENQLPSLLYLTTILLLLISPLIIWTGYRLGRKIKFSFFVIDSIKLQTFLLIFCELSFLGLKYAARAAKSLAFRDFPFVGVLKSILESSPLLILFIFLSLLVLFYLFSTFQRKSELLSVLMNSIFRKSYAIIAIAGLVTTVLFAGYEMSGVIGKLTLPQRKAYDGDRPNVLIILVDALRIDCLGFMNPRLPDITPNLDHLASESVIFNQAYTTTCWTLPSVASLFTSEHPVSHGVRHLPPKTVLSSSNITMAEIFNSTGYYTSAVIANPVLDDLLMYDQGFDDFINISSPLGKFTAMTKYDRFIDLISKFLSLKYHYKYYPAEYTTERTLKKLRQIKRTNFMLYVHYMDPHDPYYLHKEYYPANLEGDCEEYRQLVGTEWFVEKAVLSEELKNYFTEVGYTDTEVGKLLRGLDDLGLRDNTIVVFMTDHGEAFWDHGILGHETSLNSELVQIPLTFRYPYRLPPGTNREDLASVLDILPTLVDLCSLPASSRFKGYSLFADNGFNKEDRSLFLTTKFREDLISLVGDKWHYINTIKSNKKELYDRRTDPKQRTNLAEKYSALADSLHDTAMVILNDLNREIQLSVGESKTKEIDPEVIERLKSLGYIK